MLNFISVPKILKETIETKFQELKTKFLIILKLFLESSRVWVMQTTFWKQNEGKAVLGDGFRETW